MAFKPSRVVNILGFGAFLSRASSSDSRNTMRRSEWEEKSDWGGVRERRGENKKGWERGEKRVRRGDREEKGEEKGE